ncbi:RNA repair transcriptional activator RtcR family protein [Roseinatronobacter monicus]|uniref:Transcriptional regulatory protein RtcR n=1 Tax=Roseinatronobacter monicus TaxID=393481 RepID=A0A543K5X2_9RHOB|nr:RNA repair transcriptional activator RtcR family protein [Roseinatronobacter monicus]TQM90488.1 transcriptional regulatory protein RtcR [Roseinatronobacter monicus]
MRNVVIGFLGTQLDRGKRRGWRPSVQLCAHDGFGVDRLELIHDGRHYHLACQVAADIARLSSETEVRLVQIDLADPWDFQEVYGKLYDFAKDYGFDEDRERYHIHLTTGTHVAQICWFLLTESRHIPARLIQTGPPRDDKTANGTLDIIDLDLARYNALQRRFEAAAREHSALLLGGVETKSPEMLALAAELDLIISHSDAPITLVGEAGTGKSVLAARLHELKLIRRRVKGRLVSVNCATLRGDAALAALLGQRRGMARQERAGLLREADGGVLLLDRVDELAPDLQAALVQAVETGRYFPVGSDAEVTSRFHLIATTADDPAAAVAGGAMRPELAALLSQWALYLPPLRARKCDMQAHVLDLIGQSEHNLDRKTGFNTDAQDAYLRFATNPATLWPGNLRDLRASVHRMATLAERGRITLPMVQAEIARLRTQWAVSQSDPDAALLAKVLPDPDAFDEFDRAQLAAVLRACRESASISAAGRRLFAASRQSKTSQNDADRLRKYLARFGLDWAKVQMDL